MGLKEVKAWETSDGEIFKFEHKNYAIHHQGKLDFNKNQEDKWLPLKAELEKKLGVSVYREDSPWDCTNSPIGECVYESDAVQKYGDECCFYCGQPEERK